MTAAGGELHTLVGCLAASMVLGVRWSGEEASCLNNNIMSKIKNFEDKWTKISDCHGICAFTSETIHAIKNLKKHIMYGCISDIPPGAGTNRNERFHHHINSLLNRSKVGILLAYALLTVVIHTYNHSSKRKS